MDLRMIGIFCLSIGLIYTLVRFFQVGLERKYWAKKGVFRWHIVSGTFVVWMCPYFLYYLSLGQSASMWVAMLQSALVIILAVTGLRMVALLNRKDTRMSRNFAMFCLIFIQMPLMTIAAGCFVLGDWLVGVAHVLSFLILVLSAMILVLAVVDFISYFTPARNLLMVHDEDANLPRVAIRDMIKLFGFTGHSETVMYANGRWAAFIGGPPIIFLASVVGLVISWQFLFLPVAVFTGAGLRSIEFYFTGAPLVNGLIAWGIFEITLFTRGKLSKVAGFAAVFFALLLPNAVLLIYPSWFGTDLVTGFFKTLFLGLE